jgi:hypothetical protein
MIFHTAYMNINTFARNYYKQQCPEVHRKAVRTEILSDVILFASISLKPVDDKPQQSI